MTTTNTKPEDRDREFDSEIQLGSGRRKADKVTVEMPRHLHRTPTYALIEQHQNLSGAKKWNRERFYKLCVALNETIEEVGLRCGMPPYTVKRRLKENSFMLSEGILLQQLWNYICGSLAGINPDDHLRVDEPNTSTVGHSLALQKKSSAILLAKKRAEKLAWMAANPELVRQKEMERREKIRATQTANAATISATRLAFEAKKRAAAVTPSGH